MKTFVRSDKNIEQKKIRAKKKEIKIKPKCNSVQQQMHGGVSRVTRHRKI